jgi:predicted ATPase/DNA-binding SARP family transcriptional activator/tetratricopeptide (TPR) repeat protein
VLTVAVLGPVELRRDGELVAVPAGKTTEVLVRLALDAGSPVSAERLIEDLWPAQAVGVTRNTLQAKVSKLRRVLGDPALVSGDATGYTLHVDPANVDALAVLRTTDPGRALALFRGELPSADWFAPHRTRLEETRLRLTEEDLAARLARGRDVIGELEIMVGAHPLREGFWHLLVTALYRAGRQADALAAYARVRRVLADELGLDPGPALQALERQVLRQDASLSPGNLPGVSASMIGRDADLRAVQALLEKHRLVTLLGPAGVGKTRLAIEVARAAAPAWLVRLDQGGPIWQSIGEAFGLSEATEAMVRDRLRGLDALLVLDNCEHLVAELSTVVDRIAGPRILATSQQPLGVDGEMTYPVEPLSVADSVTLFTERAIHQRRTFRAADGAVEAVCRSLDGLPLAIELAAARAKALSIEEIARRLGDRFTLLSDPTGRRPPRQRALRAALAWSYDLLFPDDQRGLWALACFAGGAPLDAAESVLTALGVPSASAVDVIVRLVDRSLAAVDEDAGGAVRYRLLDSVREFGLDRLRASGQADVAFGAHAAWFAAAAERAASGLRGHDQSQHLSFVRRERANIDTGLAWCAAHDPARGLSMANGFGWAWIFLGAGHDAAQRMRSALAAAPGAPPADRVDAMLFAGWFEASGGDLDRAVAEILAAATLATATPADSRPANSRPAASRPTRSGPAASDLADPRTADSGGARGVAVRPRLFLAFVHSQQGRPRDALAALAECRDVLRGWERGAAWLLTAWAQIALGDVAAGKYACDEALRLLVPLGDQWALAHAEALLGALAQAEHRFADAIAHLTRAAEAADRLGFLAAGSLHRTNLGRAHQQHGDPVAAVAAFEHAIETAHTAGDLRIVALARVRLARVLRAEGRPAEAREQVTAARRWYATAAGGDGALLADHLAAALDDDVPSLERTLAAAHTAGDTEVELLTLDALARILADDARAAEADRLLPAARHLLTDADRIDRR